MTIVHSFRLVPEKNNHILQVRQEMREKGFQRSKAMDSVRLQKLIEVCGTKENTALYLLEEWNYEPQVNMMACKASKNVFYYFIICQNLMIK